MLGKDMAEDGIIEAEVSHRMDERTDSIKECVNRDVNEREGKHYYD